MLSAQEAPLDLEQRISSIQTISQFEQLLDDYAEEGDAALHARLWRSYAELAELQGNIHAAREAFLEVHQSTGASVFLLRAAILAIELGDFKRAEEEFTVLLDTEYAFDARMHLVRIAGFTRTLDEVWAMAYTLLKEHPSPEIVYYAWELATRLRYTDKAEELEAVFVELYPASPEYMLLRAKKKNGASIVQDMPLPSRLFYAQSADLAVEETLPLDDTLRTIPYGLQVGSFSRRENALNLSRLLQEQEFTVEVQEEVVDEERFFRVLVRNSEELAAQDFIVLLRSKNVEGVLISDHSPSSRRQ